MIKNKIHILRYLFSFLISLIILLFLIFCGDVNRFIKVLSQVSVNSVIIMVIVYALSWIFRTIRLKRTTTSLGSKMPFKNLFKLNISGYALNVLLPVKIGDVARMLFLKAEGMEGDKAIASVIYIRLLDIISIIMLATPVLFIMTKESIPNWTIISVISCILIIVLIFVFLSIGKMQRLFDIIEAKFTLKVTKGLLRVGKEVHWNLRNLLFKSSIYCDMFYSILIWLLEALTCYVVALSLNAQVSPLLIIFGVSMANISKIVPATPGGIGIYEGIIVGIFAIGGIEYNKALVIAIVDHLIKNLFIISIGIPAISTTNLKLTNLLTAR